jgi:hypothetical protein
VRIDSYCRGTTQAGIGRVSDLSAGGCRITTSVPLLQGDTVVLTLKVTGRPMTLPGRVVATGARGINIRFENLTASAEHQLVEFLQSLDRDFPVISRTRF